MTTMNIATLKRTLKSYYAKTVLQGTTLCCPVCGHSSKRFLSYGVNRRKNAQCGVCGSLERDRFNWIYIEKETNLFDDTKKNVLHFAPEQCFENCFRERIEGYYLTADLYADNVMEAIDITQIPYPDNVFDVIYCSHVLEHVYDDQRAMREMKRVLKPGGWAIIQVPIDESRENTYEDHQIINPQDRLVHFGQVDHVRCYGQDYATRLENAGFSVTTIEPNSQLTSEEIARYGLTHDAGTIFHCSL